MDKIIAAMRAQGATDADIEAYLRQAGAVEEKPSSPKNNVPSRALINATNAAEAAALRTPGEEMAALFNRFVDAAGFGLPGLAVDALSPGGFRANRDFRRADRETTSGAEQIATGIAGGIANPIGSLLGPAKAGAGFLRTFGKGMLEGGLQGGLQQLGENVGTTDGAMMPTAAGVAGGLLFGGPAAVIGARMAGRAPDAVARRVADVAEADQPLTRTVPVLPPGMRPTGLDIAGPTTMAHARGAARSVGGREVFEEAFGTRESMIPEAITGDVPNAVARGNTLREARKIQADKDYTAAVEATKGQPILTPTLDELRQTPTGRAAWLEVVKSRPDLVLATDDPARALPIVETRVGGAADRPPGFLLSGGQVDQPVVRREQVPDAEAIHLMTRYLRNWSKGEKGQIFPEGVNAESAQNALKLLEKAKAELPEPFRIANERYAAMSRPIDALEMGRSRWAANPTGRKAERLAVENVKAAEAEMSPQELAMLRMGKTFDVATRVREGTLSPAKAVEKLKDPRSTFAEEVGVMGPKLADRLRAADRILSRQKQIVTGSGPAIDQVGGTVLENVAEAAAPTPEWWIIKAGRRALGHSAKDARRRQSLEDAAFAKLLTGNLSDFLEAVEKVNALDQRLGRFAARASTAAGRAGLLAR